MSNYWDSYFKQAVQKISTNKHTYNHLQLVLLSIVLVDPYPDLAIPTTKQLHTSRYTCKRKIIPKYVLQ
jgi:hypothetical protein